MTPYIQQQLKKLCDNPNWYDDMLISWDKNPRNQREAIYNYLSHVQLNGLLENTQIVFHRWRHETSFLFRNSQRYQSISYTGNPR
jgi:hypothetical protein